jgi:hydroxymethylglutaryl-CoA lyase
MLAAMSIETGLNLPMLLHLRAKVAGWLEGELTHGALWRAGLPVNFVAAAANRAVN